MPLSFPNNPSIGDEYVGINDVLYVWDGEKWKSANNIGPSLFGISSGIPPSGASNGDAWFDTESGRAYVYYIDADSAQWIDMSPTWNGTLPSGSVYPSTLSSGGPSWTASGDLTVPGALTVTSGLTVDTDSLYVDASNNRVGIGSTNPSTPLDIRSDSAGAVVSLLKLNNNAAIASGKGVKIEFGLSDSSTASARGYIENVLDGSNGTYMAFGVNDGATGTFEALRIDRNRRLLVGTSTAVGGYTLQIEQNAGSDPFEGSILLKRGFSNAAITSAGVYLGSISAGSQTNVGGFIRFESDAAWGTGAYPTRLVFSTTADGASSPTERMRINSSGHVTTPYQPLFHTTGTNYTQAAGGYSIIVPSAVINSNGTYSGGQYTAPVTGYYIFGFWGLSYPHNADVNRVAGFKNGTVVGHYVQFGGNATLHEVVSGTLMVYLTAFDTFDWRYYQNSGSGKAYSAQWNMWGYLAA